MVSFQSFKYSKVMQALGGLGKDHEFTSKVAQTHSPSKESQLLEELPGKANIQTH